MNGTAVSQRTASAGMRSAVWAVGAAMCATLLAQGAFIVGIGIAEVSAVVFDLTERAGVPLFAGIIAVTGIVCGALIHVIVRALGRSTELPWVIWPAMAALPTLWVFIALADGSGTFEPTLAVIQLVGIGIAFATLGERRWTKG